MKCVAFLLGAAALSAVAAAQPIYSNIDSPVIDRFTGSAQILSQNGQIALTKATTAGGGTLDTITFSAGVPSFGPIGPTPFLTDATVFLFADDGDGNPDDDADMTPDVDQLLFQSAAVSLPGVLEGNHILHTIDVSGAGVSIASGQTLWLGVVFSDTSFGQVVYSPPAVGSTDGAFWSPSNPFSLGANTSLGFELTVPAPGLATSVGLAGLALALRRRRPA